MGLLVFTGLCVSDVVRLGRQHVAGGIITITLHKNRGRKPVTLRLPILPELQAVMDKSELGATTFLVTDHGKPFASAKSFGNKVRDWCDQAGLPHCTGTRFAQSRRDDRRGERHASPTSGRPLSASPTIAKIFS